MKAEVESTVRFIILDALASVGGASAAPEAIVEAVVAALRRPEIIWAVREYVAEAHDA